MASLSIDKVQKSFGATEVLKSVDIDIESGEFLVLVGPSGCGKSTLLNLIAGLESITAGEIRIDPDGSTVLAVRRQIGGSVLPPQAITTFDVTTTVDGGTAVPIEVVVPILASGAVNGCVGGSVEALMEAFMDSPEHRVNILNPAYRALGVGVIVTESGRIYVTQRFAKLSG